MAERSITNKRIGLGPSIADEVSDKLAAARRELEDQVPEGHRLGEIRSTWDKSQTTVTFTADLLVECAACLRWSRVGLACESENCRGY